MDKPRHDPKLSLPWQVREEDDGQLPCDIETKGGHMVATVYPPSSFPYTAAASAIAHQRAREIVTAMNSHEGLTEAMERLLQVATAINAIQHAGGKIEPSLWSELYDATNSGRAALRKAKPKVKTLGDILALASYRH